MITKVLPVALLVATTAHAELQVNDAWADAFNYRALVGHSRECDDIGRDNCVQPLTAKEQTELAARHRSWIALQRAQATRDREAAALNAQVAGAEAQIEAMEMVMEIDAASASTHQPIPMPEAPIEAPASSYYDRASAEIAAEQRAIEARQAARLNTAVAAPEYGTRTDIYLMDDGEIQIQEHMSSDEDDEVRVYDYDFDADVYDE